jgi:hypothetical protein
MRQTEKKIGWTLLQTFCRPQDTKMFLQLQLATIHKETIKSHADVLRFFLSTNKQLQTSHNNLKT